MRIEYPEDPESLWGAFRVRRTVESVYFGTEQEAREFAEKNFGFEVEPPVEPRKGQA